MSESLTGVLFFVAEKLGDLLPDFVVWNLDIVFGGAIVGHERKETVVGDIKLLQELSRNSQPVVGMTYQLVFSTSNIGNLHVVGGWRQIFQLLSSEDINGNQMNLGVTVLSSLGGRHINNFAGTPLDDNVTVLS